MNETGNVIKQTIMSNLDESMNLAEKFDSLCGTLNETFDSVMVSAKDKCCQDDPPTATMDSCHIVNRIKDLNFRLRAVGAFLDEMVQRAQVG